MHYIIKSDEMGILCTCKVDTPNADLHNILPTQLQTEPDLAAVPSSVLEIPEATFAAMIATPVASPWVAAAAAAIIKTLVRVAMGLTRMEMCNSGTNPGAITVVMGARMASRCAMAMAMTMTMNHDLHDKDPTY